MVNLYQEIRDINRLLSEKFGQIADIDSHPLKNLLKKCPNIKTIEFKRISINDSVLFTITELCSRLESIGFDVWDVSEEAIARFGQKLGSDMKSIAFYGDQEHKQTLMLSFCPNLRSLVCDVLPLEQFLTNLNKIDLKLSSEPQISTFIDFVDLYAPNIIDVSLHMSKHSVQKMTDNLGQISRFSNLKHLNLELFGLLPNMEDVIVNELTDIGHKCNQLTTISLSIFLEFSFNLAKSFKAFDSIKQLYFYAPNCVLQDSSQSVKSLLNLKKLTITCQSVSNNFFASIAKLSPNLEYLELYSRCNLTDISLFRLTQLKQLRELKLVPSDESHIHDDSNIITDLLNECPQLHTIVFDFEMNLSRQTIASLIEIANKRPKRLIYFEYYFTEDELQSNQLANIPDIPNNLIIRNGIPFDLIDSWDLHFFYIFCTIPLKR